MPRWRTHHRKAARARQWAENQRRCRSWCPIITEVVFEYWREFGFHLTDPDIPVVPVIYTGEFIFYPHQRKET